MLPGPTRPPGAADLWDCNWNMCKLLTCGTVKHSSSSEGLQNTSVPLDVTLMCLEIYDGEKHDVYFSNTLQNIPFNKQATY